MEFRYSISNNGIARFLSRKGGRNSEDFNTNFGVKEESLNNLNKGFTHNNELSVTSKKKIIKRINWLNHVAEVKLFKDSKNQIHQYKLIMVTLTLPSEMVHTPKFVTQEIFVQWLKTCRRYYGLKNYIWKLELQKNGNVHYHLITDADLTFHKLQKSWNAYLSNYSYISAYREKFKNMGLKKYTNYRLLQMGVSKNTTLNFNAILMGLKKTYEKNTQENWNNPNTVNVRRISINSNIEYYIAKYISKSLDEDKTDKLLLFEGKKPVIGRIWSSSENLSKIEEIKNHIQEELHFAYHYFSEVMHFTRIDYDYFNFVPIKLNLAVSLLKELKQGLNYALKKLEIVPYQEKLFERIDYEEDLIRFILHG